MHIVQRSLCFSVLGHTSVVDAATLTHKHFFQMLSLASLCLGSLLPWHPDADAWSLCDGAYHVESNSSAILIPAPLSPLLYGLIEN